MRSPPGTPVYWTPERLRELKDLWALGYSASQIAARMEGCLTRNAVIGAAHRAGLPTRRGRRRALPPKGTTAPRNVRVTLPAVTLPPAPPRTRAAPPEEPVAAPSRVRPAGAVAFSDLAPGECRFPLWVDGAEGTHASPACGRPAAVGSYCAEHWAATHAG